MRAWAMFNAGLVGLDFFVILYGIYLIKVRRDVEMHKKTMIAAGLIFVFFLLSFLLKVATQGVQPMPTWPDNFFHIQPRHILYVHEAVALVTVPLIIMAYVYAFKKDFRKHKRVARWAAPLWLFESAFGIVEFFILYGA